MPELIAAVDQGTSSTRCILFEPDGSIRARCQREHRQLYPRAGWVEHDPLEIWSATREVISGALTQGGAGAADLAAVGLTNQRETVVFWDRLTGQPYGQAIVWQDTRSRELCDRLAQEGGHDRFRALTGLPVSTYFSGPKIAWALENVAGLRPAVEHGRALCGTIDSWLLWQLTGGIDGGQHVTDVTNASRTQLMNLSRLEWEDSILEELRIPRDWLPRIVPSVDAEAFGITRSNGPFGGEVVIGGVLGDQQAALMGQCCFEPGDAKCTYGTGCFLLVNTGSTRVDSTSGLLSTVAFQRAGEPPLFALEGSVAVAGALVQWLRDNLGIIDSADQIEALAREVDDSAGVYIVPAFSGLFAPYWRSDARGVIVGLTRFVDRRHIARAALEATAYQTADLLRAMLRDVEPIGLGVANLKVDGGMVVNDLLMQFQADLLNRPVARPKVIETTALGAAFAAGLATGVHSGTADLRTAFVRDREFRPSLGEPERARFLRGWAKAVDRSLGWIE